MDRHERKSRARPGPRNQHGSTLPGGGRETAGRRDRAVRDGGRAVERRGGDALRSDLADRTGGRRPDVCRGGSEVRRLELGSRDAGRRSSESHPQTYLQVPSRRSVRGPPTPRGLGPAGRDPLGQALAGVERGDAPRAGLPGASGHYPPVVSGGSRSPGRGPRRAYRGSMYQVLVVAPLAWPAKATAAASPSTAAR